MSGPAFHPDLYVVARLLERVGVADRPPKRTQLQQSAGMNYSQLERYLEWLEGRGLLTTRAEADGPVVELTPKGHEALVFLARGIREVLRDEFRKGWTTGSG